MAALSEARIALRAGARRKGGRVELALEPGDTRLAVENEKLAFVEATRAVCTGPPVIVGAFAGPVLSIT